MAELTSKRLRPLKISLGWTVLPVSDQVNKPEPKVASEVRQCRVYQTDNAKGTLFLLSMALASAYQKQTDRLWVGGSQTSGTMLALTLLC